MLVQPDLLVLVEMLALLEAREQQALWVQLVLEEMLVHQVHRVLQGSLEM